MNRGFFRNLLKRDTCTPIAGRDTGSVNWCERPDRSREESVGRSESPRYPTDWQWDSVWGRE